MAIDIVARALAVSGKQNLSNYYTKNESDARYVKQLTDTVAYDRLYGRTNLGAESGFKILAYGQENRTIVQRTDDGTVRTNNPTDPLDAVNKQYANANYHQLTEGTAVSSSDTIDLNTYKTAGTYKLPASPKTNVPPDVGSATPGKLIVEYIYSNDCIIQTYYSLSNVGKQYRRVFDAVWTDWEEPATTSYVDNKKMFSVTLYEAGD